MCEYSFFAPCLFDSIKSKHDFYRGTDCMIKVCADLRKHATEITNYEKKENLSLRDGKIKSYNNKKNCHICKKTFHDVDDSDDSNEDSDDSYGDSDNEKFDAKKFYGDAARLDDVDQDYFDQNDDSSDKSNDKKNLWQKVSW